MIPLKSNNRNFPGHKSIGFVSQKYLSNYGDFQDKKLSHNHIESHDSYIRNQKSTDSLKFSMLSSSLSYSELNYDKRKNRASQNNLNYYNNKSIHSTDYLRNSDLNFYLKKDNNHEKYHETIASKQLPSTEHLGHNYSSKQESKSHSGRQIRASYDKRNENTDVKRNQYEPLKNRTEFNTYEKIDSKNYSRSSKENSQLNSILISTNNQYTKPLDIVKAIDINQNSSAFTKHDKAILVQSSNKESESQQDAKLSGDDINLEEFKFESQKKESNNEPTDNMTFDEHDQVKIESSRIEFFQQNPNEQELEENSKQDDIEKPIQMLDDNKSGSIKYKDYLKDDSKNIMRSTTNNRFYNKKAEDAAKNKHTQSTPGKQTTNKNPINHESSLYLSPYEKEANATTNINNQIDKSNNQIVTSQFSQSQSSDIYSQNQDQKNAFDLESKQLAQSIKSQELDSSWLSAKIIFNTKLLNSLNLDEKRIINDTETILKQKENEYLKQEFEYSKILKAYEAEINSEKDWALKKQSEMSEMMNSMVVN